MPAQWWRAHHARPTPDDVASPYPVDEHVLDNLIIDMRELRLSLASDLHAAAGAVDIDAHDVAADIIESDRADLADFLRRNRTRLVRGSVSARPSETVGRGRRRRALIVVPAIPLVGALTVSAAAAAGLLPVHTRSNHHAKTATSATASQPLTSTFDQFESVVDGDPSASQVVAAATALHQQIAALLATSPANPRRVSEVARLLEMEQALLLHKQPPGTAVVLAASRRLAAQLLLVAPRSMPSSTASASPAQWPSPTATASSDVHPTTTPKPTATPTTTPTPTPVTTSSPSPTSSSSGSGGGHLFSIPN